MYEYHGWLSSLESIDIEPLEKNIANLNVPYPSNVNYVNSSLHIAFSGNPNRNLGRLTDLLSYLVSLELNFIGCVYINDDHNSKRCRSFDVIKIVNDKIIYIEDKNFLMELFNILTKYVYIKHKINSQNLSQFALCFAQYVIFMEITI